MSEVKQYHKCSKKEGFCPTLFKRVQSVGFKGKGFVVIQTLNLEEQENYGIKTIGVSYKESANDRGLLLNYCPFCGEKIDWFRNNGEVED